MAGKQAKVLSRRQARAALRRAKQGRYPQRDRVMILLSVKAGLRAGEIAKLQWPMLLDADGCLGHRIELHDNAAKKGSGRTIPLHPELTRLVATPPHCRVKGCGDPFGTRRLAGHAAQ